MVKKKGWKKGVVEEGGDQKLAWWKTVKTDLWEHVAPQGMHTKRERGSEIRRRHVESWGDPA